MGERVEGTSVTLDAPPGFRQTTLGLDNPELEAAIAVTELPAPVDAIVAQLGPASLASRGLEDVATRQVVVDGRDALLVTGVEQAFTGKVAKWMVVFGTSTQTVMIVATAPVEARDRLDAVVVASLCSARWTAGVVPVDDLPFRFVAGPNLRVAARMGGVVLLTEHGTVGKDPAAPMVTLGWVQADVSGRELEAVAADHLREIPHLVAVGAVSGYASVRDGLRAYDLVADGVVPDLDEALRIVQHIVAREDGYVVALGRASAARFETFADEIRAILASVAIRA